VYKLNIITPPKPIVTLDDCRYCVVNIGQVGSGTFITTAPTHTLPGCLEPGGYNISLIFGCLLGAWYGRNFIYDKYNIGL
jgi:hypothetical protein